MAGAGPGARRGPGRVSMQEHMAIDVSPGPIRPILRISDYFPHFYRFAAPASDPRPRPRPAPAPPAELEPEGDSDDSTALGALEFTLLFDADNCALHCTAHRAKGLRPPASGCMDTYVKAHLLPGTSKVRPGCRVPGAGSRAGGRAASEGQDLPPPGQPAADSHGARLAGARLGGDAHLPRLHPPGRGAQDAAAVRVRGPAAAAPAPGSPPGRAAGAAAEAGAQPRAELRRVPGEAQADQEAPEPGLGPRHGPVPGGRGRGGGGRGGARARPAVAVLQLAARRPARGGAALRPPGAHGRQRLLGPLRPPEFFFVGPREELAQRTLLVSVWDYDLGTADDFIGGVQLSGQAGGDRQRHWRECLGRSDRRLELWHPLDDVSLQFSD